MYKSSLKLHSDSYIPDTYQISQFHRKKIILNHFHSLLTFITAEGSYKNKY